MTVPVTSLLLEEQAASAGSKKTAMTARAATGAAARHDEGYRESCAALRARHLDAARELAGGSAGDLAAAIEERFGDLGDLLHGVYLMLDF